MHPEIKKYWEDVGYQVAENALTDRFHDGTWRIFYFLKKNDQYLDVVAMSKLITSPALGFPRCEFYRFLDLNSPLYSEDEMLRLVRMKVFA